VYIELLNKNFQPVAYASLKSHLPAHTEIISIDEIMSYAVPARPIVTVHVPLIMHLAHNYDWMIKVKKIKGATVDFFIPAHYNFNRGSLESNIEFSLEMNFLSKAQETLPITYNVVGFPLDGEGGPPYELFTQDKTVTILMSDVFGGELVLANAAPKTKIDVSGAYIYRNPMEFQISGSGITAHTLSTSVLVMLEDESGHPATWSLDVDVIIDGILINQSSQPIVKMTTGAYAGSHLARICVPVDIFLGVGKHIIEIRTARKGVTFAPTNIKVNEP
jgi:hypothetical protein